jgi:DNA-binding MarR family transcriptional regulator/N-acetylglutamate synthase-like GNAT family acetyltransferase
MELASVPNNLVKSVQAVRRFNRFYTRKIGVLEEGLLKSPYSLTEVRVLYELANRQQTTASELAANLALDAGYLSRIVQKFEKLHFVDRTRSKQDGRQSLLELTQAGKKAFAPLDSQSSEQVRKMLANLSASQQVSLIKAMSTIQSTLELGDPVGTPYLLREHQPGDMGWVVHRHGVLYSQEYGYDERFEALVAEIVGEFIKNYDRRRERCWMAERDGEIVGSVFLVKQSNSLAKLRLLLVEPSARGLGIGRRLVAECIRLARQAGYKKVILWTQSELTAARKLYQHAGFKLVKQAAHESWGRDDLVSETWELKL